MLWESAFPNTAHGTSLAFMLWDFGKQFFGPNIDHKWQA